MRVLHAISGIDPRNGGPTAALLGWTGAQVRAGLEVSVVATWHEADAHTSAEALRKAGVEVHMVGPAGGMFYGHPELGPTLARLTGQCDVVHVHGMWEEIQHRAARVARRSGVPYVVTPHGMLDRWNFTKGRAKKHLYLAIRARRNLKGAAALHFATEIERDAVRRFDLGVREIVEPLGLDLAEFRELPGRGAFRARFPQIGHRVAVMFLGRIHRGKGLELLVPAFAKVRTGREVLVIVGPDSFEHRKAVEAEVARLGMEGDVVFTGMVRGRERIEAIVDCDVLAAPSAHENFGIAVAEAMVCGRPVVVSDQVNLHRDVTAAGAGGVVPLDVDALAAELAGWLNDPARRDEAGRRGREWALARYDWDVIARHWVRYYQSVVR